MYLDEKRKNHIINNLKEIKLLKTFDVVVTGVTGSGKSTTINSLLGEKRAKIGTGFEAETKETMSFEFGDFIKLWDTPGIGDSTKNDAESIENITDLLNQEYLPMFPEYDSFFPDNTVNPVLSNTKRFEGSKNLYNATLDKLEQFINLHSNVNLALVVIDGSSKDMGMTYKLLNDVLIPKFGSEQILVVINQADVAMKGIGWEREKNLPNEELAAFLDAQADSVQKRIKDTCNIDILKPIPYSGEHGYNVDKIVDFIISNMATIKRVPRERVSFAPVIETKLDINKIPDIESSLEPEQELNVDNDDLFNNREDIPVFSSSEKLQSDIEKTTNEKLAITDEIPSSTNINDTDKIYEKLKSVLDDSQEVEEINDSSVDIKTEPTNETINESIDKIENNEVEDFNSSIEKKKESGGKSFFSKLKKN